MKIVIRAENAGGPDITGSKAAAILATGGTVVAVAVGDDHKKVWGIEATASATRSFRDGTVDEPVIGWTSLARNTAEVARLHAQAVNAVVKAVELAKDGTDWFDSDHIPGWVSTRLGEFDDVALSHYASRAYSSGQFTINDAWEYAVKRTEEARAK